MKDDPSAANANADAVPVELAAELVLLRQQLALLGTALEIERADRRAEAETRRRRELVAEAETFVRGLVHERRIADEHRTGIAAVYLQAAHDDQHAPAEVSRLAALRTMLSRLAPVPADRSGMRVVSGAVEGQSEQFWVGPAWGE